MSQPDGHPPRWVENLALLGLAIAALGSLAWGAVHALRDSDDLMRRAQEVSLFLDRLDPYSDPDSTYPPTAFPVLAPLIAPFGSGETLRAAWLGLNVAAALALAAMLVRFWADDWPARGKLALGLVVLASRPTRAGIALGQFHLIPTALLVGSALVLRGQTGLARRVGRVLEDPPSGTDDPTLSGSTPPSVDPHPAAARPPSPRGEGEEVTPSPLGEGGRRPGEGPGAIRPPRTREGIASSCAAGLLVGLALIKPTMALPMLIVLAVRRHWAALATALALQAALFAGVCAWLRLGPVVLIREWLQLARGQAASGTIDLPTLLPKLAPGLSLDPSWISLAVLVAATLALFALRGRSDRSLVALALMIAAIFTYHRHYDLVLLLLASAEFAARAFHEADPRRRRLRLSEAAFYALALIATAPPDWLLQRLSPGLPTSGIEPAFNAAFVAISYLMLIRLAGDVATGPEEGSG